MPGRIFFPLVFAIIASLSFGIYKTRGGKGKKKAASISLMIVLVLFVVALTALGLWLWDFTNNYTF